MVTRSASKRWGRTEHLGEAGGNVSPAVLHAFLSPSPSAVVPIHPSFLKAVVGTQLVPMGFPQPLGFLTC